MKYAILSVIVISWCSLHSAMISVSVTEYLHKRLGRTFRFYRLFFNMISILTLIPVVLWVSSARTEPIFRWDGYIQIIQVLLLGTAALLFFLGALRYDFGQLLGFKQIREETNKCITGACELDTSGVLSVVRHPWYLATILLIWARPVDISIIVANVMLTCYLVIGTYLEEKKLILEFGENYRSYQRRVSMLVPIKWIRSKIQT